MQLKILCSFRIWDSLVGFGVPGYFGDTGSRLFQHVLTGDGRSIFCVVSFKK